jgi:hypothetical protein
VRKLKEDVRTRDIPVVALSASVMAADKERAAEAGCAEFIEKPVIPDTLIDVIRRVLAPPVPSDSPVSRRDEAQPFGQRFPEHAARFGIARGDDGRELLRRRRPAGCCQSGGSRRGDRLRNVPGRIVRSRADLCDRRGRVGRQLFQRQQRRDPAFRDCRRHDGVQRTVERQASAEPADRPEPAGVPRLAADARDQLVAEFRPLTRVETLQ